jgi:AAA domain (dynein-related subfamily)
MSYQPTILSPSELSPFLLDVALVRPVFIWGAPGIGKSDLVNSFGEAVGLECVSILGSQLAPEDLMGVPRIENGFTRFYPPSLIARDKPYLLFLDELNGCSPDVQKAFYSLILDQRVGEYSMPKGSVVIAAGNRAEDGAIVRTLPTPLINRVVHVHLEPRLADWLIWARSHDIHPWITSFLEERPTALWSKPSKDQSPFSTPRSWHMLSDGLNSMKISDEVPEARKQAFDALVYGTLNQDHANQFRVFIKQADRRHYVHQMLKGKATWPHDPEQQDWLVFLIDSFRDALATALPVQSGDVSGEVRKMAHTAKGLIGDLAKRNEELARNLIAVPAGERALPNWFLVEIMRDLPHLAIAQKST